MRASGPLRGNAEGSAEPPCHCKNEGSGHLSYVTEIKQLGRDMRITLYEKAHIDPAGIPVLMQKYRRGLQFKAEQEPKFIYTPQGRPLEALTDFLTELNSPGRE